MVLNGRLSIVVRWCSKVWFLFLLSSSWVWFIDIMSVEWLEMSGCLWLLSISLCIVGVMILCLWLVVVVVW